MTVIITTPAEVFAMTGDEVTTGDIAKATGIIEAMSGAELTDPDLTTVPHSTRDARLLERAVAWQAAYVAQADNDGAERKPGNLTSASNGDVSVAYGAGGSGGAILSPLAAKYLARLSWRRSRSLKVKRQAAPTRVQTLVNDGSDREWSRL